jgi:hypothetical protein
VHEIAVVTGGFIRTRCGEVVAASGGLASAWHAEVDCEACRAGVRCDCGHTATVHTLETKQKKQCGALEGCKCTGWART